MAAKKSVITGTTLGVAALLIIVAVLAYLVLLAPAPTPPGGTPTATPAAKEGKIFQGEFGITVKEWGGDLINGTANPDIKAYLTKANQYASTYAAREAIKENSGLVSATDSTPGALADTSGVRTGLSDGKVIFTAQAPSATAGGQTYQIYVHDESGKYADFLGNVKLEGYFGSATDEVINSMIATGFVGQTITLSKTGQVQVVNDGITVTGYLKNVSGAATNDSKTFDFVLKLGNDTASDSFAFTKIADATIYVNVSNIDNLDIPSIFVNGKEASLEKVSDLAAANPIKKNKPAGSIGTDGELYYLTWKDAGVDKTGVGMQRVSETNEESVTLSIKDMSYTVTTAPVTAIFTIVPYNGYYLSAQDVEQARPYGTFVYVVTDSADLSTWVLQ
jgi:hypothetical protein